MAEVGVCRQTPNAWRCMLISVVNHTGGTLSDEKVQDGIAPSTPDRPRSKPHWHVRRVWLEGSVCGPTRSDSELRGDAIIYLWNGANVDALGFPRDEPAGVPFVRVHRPVKSSLRPWTVTFSHGRSRVDRRSWGQPARVGPHPADRTGSVPLHEMCDAVGPVMRSMAPVSELPAVRLHAPAESAVAAMTSSAGFTRQVASTFINRWPYRLLQPRQGR